MSYVERVLAFECEQEQLIGIVCRPAADARLSSIGVVLVVGGPQYRVGSHRQFVQTARALASDGFASLRFDCRGMGDSAGIQGDFQGISPDISASLDAFATAQPGVNEFVLWGLCDGASAALLYVGNTKDPRVVGLCLLNPWVRSTASLARVHVKQYYTRRLLEGGFWRKLLRGGLGWQAVSGLLKNIRLMRRSQTDRGPSPTSYQDKMALAWRKYGGRILLLTSAKDLTAKEFLDVTGASDVWRGALIQPGTRHLSLPDADHTLSERQSLSEANRMLSQWLIQWHAKEKQ